VTRRIAFKRPLLLAVMNGRKTETRRLRRVRMLRGTSRLEWQPCPYGSAGDLLDVTEPWCLAADADGYPEEGFLYAADYQPGEVVRYGSDGVALRKDGREASPWRSGRFMPSAAVRLRLRLDEVRAERLHDITDEGAQAEGTLDRDAFRGLWDIINGKLAPWDADPWVWVLRFRVASLGARRTP
jgi:hypothetical protein